MQQSMTSFSISFVFKGYEQYHVVSQEANKIVINMPMEEIGVEFVYSRQQEMKTFSS